MTVSGGWSSLASVVHHENMVYVEVTPAPWAPESDMNAEQSRA